METQSSTVVLDPGHGGTDTAGASASNNATGPNGLLEKDVTLDLARRVSALLAGRANVVLTRVGDTNRSLTERAGVAKAANADVFVSIHMNGWRDPALDGTEAWVAKGADDRSRALARSVLDRVVAVTHAPDRGVCEADLGVLCRHDRARTRPPPWWNWPSSRTPPRPSASPTTTTARRSRRRSPTGSPTACPRRRASGRGGAVVVRDVCPSALKLALTKRAVAYAHPLFDTGEHVQSGGDLYENQLFVGQSPVCGSPTAS